MRMARCCSERGPDWYEAECPAVAGAANAAATTAVLAAIESVRRPVEMNGFTWNRGMVISLRTSGSDVADDPVWGRGGAHHIVQWF
jgi:hypothetical protein